MKSRLAQAFGKTVQKSDVERVSKTSTLLQSRVQEASDTGSALSSNLSSTTIFNMKSKPESHDDTISSKPDLFLFKECSFSDQSLASRTPSTADPTRSNPKSWKGFTTPRSRRFHDGPQSLRRLRLDSLQQNEHLISEMAINTPGRISPRNIPKSQIVWNDLEADSGELFGSASGSLEEGMAVEEEMAVGLEEKEFPKLTDCDVVYTDSWTCCQTPTFVRYLPCDTIEEVEGES